MFSDSKKQPYFRQHVLEKRSESGDVNPILGSKTVVTGTSNFPESLWVDYKIDSNIFAYLLECMDIMTSKKCTV